MLGFCLDEGLISANQSYFKPGDSCINQLLSITQNIYKSLDDGYEVRGVFLIRWSYIRITRKWNIR